MKFQKGDIVKVIEDVGLFIEKGAVGRVKEVDGSGCLIESVEGYEENLGGKQRYVSEIYIELYEGRDSTMKKEDLENGMVVEDRRGDRFLVVDDFLYGLKWYESLNDIEDDLTSYSNSLDIVKVYKKKAGSSLVDLLNGNEYLNLIWERKETLYFDARKSLAFKDNFNSVSISEVPKYFKCHGLTKEETKERGYNWLSSIFTKEKPEPLKIIDGRVE